MLKCFYLNINKPNLSNTIRNFFYFIFIFFASVLPINAQWLDAYIADFKVNDDNLNSYQTNSVIGVDTAGNFVIAWNDVRINPGNQSPTQIYCQRYNKDGLALGNNFRIGQDTAGGIQICMLRDGRFIMIWGRSFIENNINKFDFYYQKFDKEGISLSLPNRIMDTNYINGTSIFTGMNIASDSSGNFVIVWSIRLNVGYKSKIFFQRYDSSGVRTGGIDSVNEANSNAEFPSVAMNYDGSFVIGWQDDRFTGGMPVRYDIFMQRYNSNAVKIGNNVKVNDENNPNIDQLGAKVSTDGRGISVIVWSDERDCNLGEVYYQIYDTNGAAIGVNRKANTSDCITGTGDQRVSMRNDKKFYIGWSDWNLQGRNQFYGRRFDSLGNALGNQYMIPANSPSNTIQRANDIKLLSDRVYSTWHDNRNGGTLNYDIYCNVRGFQNPDTVIGINNITSVADKYELYPAYPNPFNPVTNIKYQITNSKYVTLNVIDILGRDVTTLVEQRQNAGTYVVKWDAGNYPSGVYFYQLAADGYIIDTKKMIVLK